MTTARNRKPKPKKPLASGTKLYVPMKCLPWTSMTADGKPVNPNNCKAVGFTVFFESREAAVAEFPDCEIREVCTA
jgi:hypothetical protein